MSKEYEKIRLKIRAEFREKVRSLEEENRELKKRALYAQEMERSNGVLQKRLAELREDNQMLRKYCKMSEEDLEIEKKSLEAKRALCNLYEISISLNEMM